MTRTAPRLRCVHDVEVFVGVFIGAVTLTGSIVAYLKLSGKIDSAPLMLPGDNALNLGDHRRVRRDDRRLRADPAGQPASCGSRCWSP